MTTAADALLDALDDEGIDTIFGIPGVDNLAFYDAVERSSMRSLLVRHESTAGYAADAFFRVTGRPAVCFTTAGPGATNAITAMGEAWASNSTFLHITTTVASAYLTPKRPRSLPHYHPSQIRMFEPVSSTALHCESPEGLSALSREAVRAMRKPPHAPGFLQVPYDFLGVEVATAATFAPPSPAAAGPTGAALEAARVLNESKAPLIWVGSGGLGAIEPLMGIAERLGAPVILTHSAKRRFEAIDHPLVVPYPPHEPPVRELIESSDAILVVGSDLDAMMTKQFSVRFPPSLIHVDVASEHIGMNYPAAIAIEAAAEVALPVILSSLATREGGTGLGRAEITRTAVLADLGGEQRGDLPVHFLDAVDGCAPPDAIIVCDMAVPGYWAAGYLPLRPARQLLYPIGWGTLGFGLPASIGAAVAGNGRRVIAILGDAGAMYATGDLATIADHQLPITVVVVDDGGYGMLRYAAKQRFGRSFAVDLKGPMFKSLGEAFGIDSYVSDLNDPDLASLLTRATSTDGPSLVWLKGSLTPPRMAILTPPQES